MHASGPNGPNAGPKCRTLTCHVSVDSKEPCAADSQIFPLQRDDLDACRGKATQLKAEQGTPLLLIYLMQQPRHTCVQLH